MKVCDDAIKNFYLFHSRSHCKSFESTKIDWWRTNPDHSRRSIDRRLRAFGPVSTFQATQDTSPWRMISSARQPAQSTEKYAHLEDKKKQWAESLLSRPWQAQSTSPPAPRSTRTCLELQARTLSIGLLAPPTRSGVNKFQATLDTSEEWSTVMQCLSPMLKWLRLFSPKSTLSKLTIQQRGVSVRRSEMSTNFRIIVALVSLDSRYKYCRHRFEFIVPTYLLV